MQEQVVGRRPAVGPERAHVPPRRRRHRLDRVAGLEGDRLEHGAGQVRPPRPPAEPDHRPAGVGVPPRASEPGEGGHDVDALGVGDRGGQRLHVRRLGDDPEAVAQPLHGGAGDEDGALEGVGDLAAGQLPGDAGEQPFDGWRALGAHVHEDERAGAVGVLGHPRREARLAEQGGLLVAGDAGDRDALGDGQAGRRRPDAPAGGPDLG